MTAQSHDPSATDASAAAEEKQASQFTKPLREMTAFVLLGATAMLLFVAVIQLIPIGYGRPFRYLDFVAGRFGSFVNLATIGMPVLAVLIATHVTPMVSRAKMITLVALVEYLVAAFFGLIFGLLLGFAGDISDESRVINLTDGSVRGALESALGRLVFVAVLAVAALVVYRVWQGMFYVPRPKAVPTQPGVYGQPTYPQQGYPQQYGQQPGYPAAYPQPAYPQPGYQQYPQQPGYGQQYPAQPSAQPGYPAAPSGYPAQPSAQPSAQPDYPAPSGYPAQPSAQPGYPAAPSGYPAQSGYPVPPSAAGYSSPFPAYGAPGAPAQVPPAPNPAPAPGPTPTANPAPPASPASVDPPTVFAPGVPAAPTSAQPSAAVPVSGVPTSGAPNWAPPALPAPTWARPAPAAPTSGPPAPAQGVPAHEAPTQGAPAQGMPQGVPAQAGPLIPDGEPTKDVPGPDDDNQRTQVIRPSSDGDPTRRWTPNS